MGLGVIFGLWLVVMVTALVIGFFLKQSSIVEIGPTDTLALDDEESQASYSDDWSLNRYIVVIVVIGIFVVVVLTVNYFMNHYDVKSSGINYEQESSQKTEPKEETIEVELIEVPKSDNLVKIIIANDKIDSDTKGHFSVARFDINDDGKDDILYSYGLCGSCGCPVFFLINKGNGKYEKSICELECSSLILHFSKKPFKGMRYPEGEEGFCTDEQLDEAKVSKVHPQEPIYEISAIELLNEYKENAVAADIKYSNHFIVVSGTVHSIGKDFLDTAYVVIEDQGFFSCSGSKESGQMMA